MAVQWIAHLRSQRVACAETARQAAVRRHRHDQLVPHGRCLIGRNDELVAVLARVTGPAEHDAPTIALGDAERHVVKVCVETEITENVRRLRPLYGDDRKLAMLVDDGHVIRRDRREAPDNLAGVRRVRHEMQVVVAAVVDDQVIDDATGRLVAAQGVLRLPGSDPIEVVGQACVDEVLRAGPAHLDVAEVTDVEEPDVVAHRRVLLDNAGVLNGHLPAAELGQPRAQGDVPVVQR